MSTKVTPQSDSNLDVTVTESGNLVCLDINPASLTVAGATGTVTNVATGTGLTGGPITTTGTIAIDSTVATLDGAQALSNKTGLVSQWTNDAGYITSETDNQTLTFANPDLTISNGNTVDITMYDQTLNTTDDVTFNSVTADMYGVSKFTAKNVEGDQINKGQPVYIYGHSGSIPEVREADSAVTSEMPAFGIASEDITNNTQGNIATAGDLVGIDTTGTAEGETWAVGDTLYVGASALTNVRPTDEAHKVQSVAKVIRVHATVGQLFLSGAGRFNDVPNLDTKHVFIGDGNGYEERQLTYTDILNTPTIPADQTLSFADPVLTISGSLSTVDLSALTPTSLAWSAITSTPTTIAGYGITDAATQTTINNNANNRVITGSDTADTLEGESNFTWDGTNGLISGTASGLTTPVLKLETSNSNWNAGQLLCADSNGNVFTQVGRHNTGQSTYQWNITLDPDNTHGRTGVSTYAGDYFVAFEKNYSDQSEIRMDMKVYGAHDGFNISVRDDYNSGGGNQYGFKPLNLNALETNMNASGNLVFSANSTAITFGDSNANGYSFPLTDGTANQVLTTDGAGNLTFATGGGGGATDLDSLTDVTITNVQNNDLLMYNSTATQWQNTNLGISVTPQLSGDVVTIETTTYVLTIGNHIVYDDPAYFVEVYTGATKVVDNDDVTDNGDGTLTFAAPATGTHEIRVRCQDFGDLQSEIATKALTTQAFAFAKQYWRLKDFGGGSNTNIMISELKLYTAAAQGGTKWPTSALTTNGTPGTGTFAAFGQGYYAPSGNTYTYYKAFDNIVNSTFYWNLGTTTHTTDYVAIDLASAPTIRSMSISSGNSGGSIGPVSLYAADNVNFTNEFKIGDYEFTATNQTINIG